MIKLGAAISLCLWLGSSAFGAGKVHPVVVMQADNGGVLIGGMSSGKWLSAWRMAAKLKGGERYSLYSEDRPAGTATGSRPRKSELSEPWIKLALYAAEARIAIAGNWKVLPRIPRIESLNQKVYLAAIHDMLVSKGLGKSPANIRSVFQVDIEGDGRDEVIISAQSPGYDMLAPRKGGYSFVMVRSLVRGKVRTSLISGEFHTDNLPKQNAREYDAGGLWDVDGDGALELSVNVACQSLDASRTIIYDLADGRVRELGRASHAN